MGVLGRCEKEGEKEHLRRWGRGSKTERQEEGRDGGGGVVEW